MVALQYLACIFQIAACLLQNEDLQSFADLLNVIADATYCSVCACMQTQHKAQLDVRDGLVPPKDGILMAPPPVMAVRARSLRAREGPLQPFACLTFSHAWLLSLCARARPPPRAHIDPSARR